MYILNQQELRMCVCRSVIVCLSFPSRFRPALGLCLAVQTLALEDHRHALNLAHPSSGANTEAQNYPTLPHCSLSLSLSLSLFLPLLLSNSRRNTKEVLHCINQKLRCSMMICNECVCVGGVEACGGVVVGCGGGVVVCGGV